MPPFVSTIQESDSRVKCVLTFKTHGDCLVRFQGDGGKSKRLIAALFRSGLSVSSRVGGNGLAPWGFGLLLN